MSSRTSNGKNAIMTILQTKSNIKLTEIKNFPEEVYKGDDDEHLIDKHIFKQKVNITFFSSYIETIQYIETLEQTLPSLHWDNLVYEVTTYPTAKVEMELSIIYEKSKK